MAIFAFWLEPTKALILSQWGYPAANVPSIRLTLDRLAQRAQQLGAGRAPASAAAAPSQVEPGEAMEKPWKNMGKPRKLVESQRNI